MFVTFRAFCNIFFLYRRTDNLLVCLLLAMLLALAAAPSWAAQKDQGAIAVIYPEIGEPYRSIFAQIIEGIEDKTRGRVINLAIGPNVDTGELNELLRRQDARVVIALGRQGMKAAVTLNRSNLSIVVGGVLMYPLSMARQVMRFYSEYEAAAPDELYLSCAIAVVDRKGINTVNGAPIGR
jgi:hypothetical protein